MSGYCHTRSFPLRYTDFDFQDELKPSALLALAQEAAGSSADEIGFGYEALKPLNMGFITANTECRIFSKAKLGDTLTVETWPLPPRHVIFERHYRVKNQRGEIVALLASRWCLIDLPRFVMLPPEALGEIHARCPYNPERVMDVNYKIPRCEDPEERYRMVVKNSHCDHYFHANNTRYADFFLDGFSMTELKRVKRFLISYVKQAKEGDELVFLRARSTEPGREILEARCGGEVIARFEAEFEDGDER